MANLDSGFKISSIYDRLVIENNRCFDETNVSEWIIKGKITLIQNDPRERTAPYNHKPIIHFTMMGKILTAQNRNEIYYLLLSPELFREE